MPDLTTEHDADVLALIGELNRYAHHLGALIDAAEDVLTEAEAVFAEGAGPAKGGTPARKALRDAILAVPGDLFDTNPQGAS